MERAVRKAVAAKLSHRARNESNTEGESIMNYAEWRDDGSDRWVENDNGNLVWICSGEVIATVFTYSDESWGAVWNGSEDSEPRFLKARCDSAEEALSLLEDAIEEGDESPMWWPLGNQWTQS